jgi:hypothetical protein
MTRLGFAKPGHHLLEAGDPLRRGERRLGGRIDLAEHRQAHHLQRHERRLGGFDIILAAQPCIDIPGRALAVPDGDGDGALARHHVAPGEDPGMAGHQLRVDDHRAVRFEVDARHPAQKAAVGHLAERQHHRVGFERLDFPGRLWPAVGVEGHAFDRQRLAGDFLDAGQPPDLDAFLDRLVGLEGARRHVGAVAVIDDQRLVGAEPPRGARRIHRRIAAAVNDDAAAEERPIAGVDIAQERQRIEHPGGIPRRDVDVTADMGADRDEDGVEAAGVALGEDVLDLVIEGDAHAHPLDATDFRQQLDTRQPVGGNAEMHHTAGDGPRFPDLGSMAAAREMIGRREPARPGADDQHPLAARRRVDRELPVFCRGTIAEESFDRMDADAAVEPGAVAGVLARVIADAPVHRRQRVVADERFPGGAKLAGLGEREPSPDVLARRAGVVAGRQQIDIDGPPRAERACASLARRINERRQVASIGRHGDAQLPALPRRRKWASNESIRSSQSSISRVIRKRWRTLSRARVPRVWRSVSSLINCTMRAAA